MRDLDSINKEREGRYNLSLYKDLIETVSKVEFKKFTLEAQEGEDLHFTIYIKNPLNAITEEEILSYT